MLPWYSTIFITNYKICLQQQKLEASRDNTEFGDDQVVDILH